MAEMSKSAGRAAQRKCGIPANAGPPRMCWRTRSRREGNLAGKESGDPEERRECAAPARVRRRQARPRWRSLRKGSAMSKKDGVSSE
ncbi:hypothetical protein WS67_13510 [Burkholderia singularis]|uniref:Uncharacterized protein n=1 Tax=Burkholderia singularis TaxID=1503053 RepID=A0A103E1I5_9BURK|nr:hypothetical protein WS67_13510 [Burkholderia singularis]